VAVPGLDKKEGSFEIKLDVAIVPDEKKKKKKRAEPEGGIAAEQGRTKRGRIIKAPVRPGE
jgi:hypothetical protein